MRLHWLADRGLPHDVAAVVLVGLLGFHLPMGRWEMRG